MNEWSCNVNDQGGYGDDAYVLVTDDETYGTPIARVCCYEPGTLKRLPYEANAHLIAAAPALLEALKEAVASVEMPTGIGLGPGGLEWRFPDWFEAARAAIASATPTERGE